MRFHFHSGLGGFFKNIYSDICCKCFHLLVHSVYLSYCIKVHFVYISLNFQSCTMTFIFISPPKNGEVFFTVIYYFSVPARQKI